jgi:DNA-binding transcriptional LysR family regulator
MIDIRQMRYFVVLAETLHFGRAAERLHLSQPPLSRQIAALEQELGVRLLERHSRHATLTAAGQRFLEDARAVLASFDQACRNARLTARGVLGELSVGFMMHAANTVLPNLAHRYMEAYPQVRVTLREVIPSTLAEEVVKGVYDAGIMFFPSTVKGLTIREIHRETLCVAMHRSHRLSGTGPIEAEALANQNLIATPADVAPMLRQAIVEFCAAAGFVPTIRLEAQLQQTIVNLVSEDLGIALVPESMRKLGVPNVVFRELANAPSIAHVIAWRPGNLNPALPPFLETAGVAG